MRYSRQFAALASLLIVFVLSACATRSQQPAVATFIVVRHAEKVDDGSKDPPLNEAGLVRAQAVGDALRDVTLHGVYATAYQRTQQTATPAARTHSLPVLTYDAKLAASDFAAQLRRAHATGTVLVVGHSNTVPGIAAALCECTVSPMEDTEYDRWIRVQVDANGNATLQETRY